VRFGCRGRIDAQIRARTAGDGGQCGHCLVKRGIDASLQRLFVIDGSKAIRSAIEQVYGEPGLVQRCRAHKVRNVTERLPEPMRAQIKSVMHAATNCPRRRAWPDSDSGPSGCKRSIQMQGQVYCRDPQLSAGHCHVFGEAMLIGARMAFLRALNDGAPLIATRNPCITVRRNWSQQSSTGGYSEVTLAMTSTVLVSPAVYYGRPGS
jgi:hypothetical protein